MKKIRIFYIIVSIFMGFNSNSFAGKASTENTSLLDQLALVASCGKAQILQVIELVHGYGLALTVYPEELTNRYLLKIDEPKASQLILLQSEILRSELVRKGCQLEEEQ